MAIRKEEDEAVRRAHAIVDRAMKLQEKKDRKAFCEAVATKREDIWKARIAGKEQ